MYIYKIYSLNNIIIDFIFGMRFAIIKYMYIGNIYSLNNVINDFIFGI